MATFEKPPKKILETKEELLAAVLDPNWETTNKEIRFEVKSLWLCELIGEIAKREYPYNAVVQREAEKRLGIPQQDDNGSALSTLVYCAQKFRHSDEMLAAGYKPADEAMLREAFEAGAQIEMYSTEIFRIVVNGEAKPHEMTRYNVREIEGKLYAMEPRARKFARNITGHAAKIVPAKPAKKRAKATV